VEDHSSYSESYFVGELAWLKKHNGALRLLLVDFVQTSIQRIQFFLVVVLGPQGFNEA